VKKRKTESYGLRQRWLINSLSPIFVVVLLVAVTFCVGMTNYYYNAMRDGLRTRATHASDYFTSYSMTSYAEFYQSAYNFTKEFAERDYLEVQFIGESGKVIISSYGLASGIAPGTSDIADALQLSEIGYYRGIDPSTGEHIMSVSAPLQFNGRVRGVLRYVTAMSAVEGEILITIGETDYPITSVGFMEDGNVFALTSADLADGLYNARVVFRRTQVLELLFN